MKSLVAAASLAILFAASNLVAQEFPKMPDPQKEHEWLKQFVGEWESDSEASMGPGQPAMKCKGTIQTRSLGGFWVISELKSEMMGMSITAVQTIGWPTTAGLGVPVIVTPRSARASEWPFRAIARA